MLLDLMPVDWRYGHPPGRRRPNICPMTTPPIVRASDGEGPRMAEFTWGIKIPQRLLVNAKTENARIHAQNLTRRRCLMPASGYYEWFAVRPKLKVPQHLQPADGQPFCFAGIWGPWTQPGAAGEGFVIMTGEPGPGITWLHDRMPVVVPQEA